MPVQALPEFLTTPEALNRLVQLLIEKENVRRNLAVRDFGPRVTDDQKARHLLSRIIRVASEVLQMHFTPSAAPELVLTQRLAYLPRHIALLYLLLLPPIALFLFLSLKQPEGDGALWLVWGAIIFLLVVPLLLFRRTKINIEHQCGYVRNSEDQAVIVIDQLSTAQFLSYLAHEYGHHLYFQLDLAPKDNWIREGWARLLQWQVMQRLSQQENNPAYIYHVLVQIIGELKFACELISRVLHHRLPRKVRRMSTIYRANPLLRLLTGTPGFNSAKLLNHAVGTAFFFLHAERSGTIECLQGKLFEIGQETTAKGEGGDEPQRV